MPVIDIVTCTRNGGQYIGEQLESFARQDHID